MSKIGLPPKRDQGQGAVPATKPSEKKILDIINKGGSTIITNEPVSDEYKNFNILVSENDLRNIGAFCDKRPKKPGKKIGFSKKEWIMEAVQEKLERESKKYNI